VLRQDLLVDAARVLGDSHDPNDAASPGADAPAPCPKR
jgi:hypothetical protein